MIQRIVDCLHDQSAGRLLSYIGMLLFFFLCLTMIACVVLSARISHYEEELEGGVNNDSLNY